MKIVRIYDPSVTQRRIPLELHESACPGLIEFLTTIPYGTETPLVRGVLYQWFIAHKEAGTLDEAVNQVLSGPGAKVPGRRGGGYQKRSLEISNPVETHQVRRAHSLPITSGGGGVKAGSEAMAAGGIALRSSAPVDINAEVSAPGDTACAEVTPEGLAFLHSLDNMLK